MTEAPNVYALAVALRRLQVEFGLAGISGTMELAGDSLTLRFAGLHDPTIGYIENSAGHTVPLRPDFLA